MEPRDIKPAIRIERGDTVPFDAVGVAVERAQLRAPLMSAVPPKLAKTLLPGERVTFGTSVHPIVFLPPLCFLAVLAAVSATSGAWLTHLPHNAAWLGTGFWPKAVLGVEALLGVASLGLLVKRTARYMSLRVVATNRRIFAIRGVLVHRITPLGNTAIAGSTLSQGVLGRMFGYGSIDLPLADGTPDRFRDVRNALELYREMQAVANGVDGDTWTPAVRQTIIP